MADKKTYHVVVHVLQVTGHQIFSVQANSEEEAREVYGRTGGEFVDQELEVTSLSDDFEVFEQEAP